MNLIALYDYNNNIIAHLRFDNNRIEGDAFEPILEENINGIDKLSFNLPYKVFDKELGQIIDNWRINYIVPEGIIRFIHNNNYDEYFLIKNTEETHSNGVTGINVSCEHFSSLLQKRGLDKSIDVTDNAGVILTAILSNSGWSVGDVSTFEKNGVEKNKKIYQGAF